MPRYGLRPTGSYYLVTNLTYFSSRYQPAQFSPSSTCCGVSGEKQFKLGRRGWNWRTWVIVQQRAVRWTGECTPITTRNMIGYDGNLGFKNLASALA